MPKATTPSSSSKRRHNPLEDDLVSTGVLKNRDGRPSKRADRKQAEEQAYVDAKSSRKILAMSRDLIDEEDLQSAENNASAPSAFDFDPSRLDGDSDRDEDEFANEEAWGDEEDVVEEIEVDAADLETFNRFITPTMNDDPLLTHGWDRTGDGAEEEGPGTNLADLILAKIAEKEAMQGGRQPDYNPVEEDFELSPKVVEVFTKYVARAVLRQPARSRGADMLLGLDSFLPATNLVRCRSPSKSCRKFPTGRISSKSQGRSHGTHRQNLGHTVEDKANKGLHRTPNACYAATRIFVAAKPLVVQRFMEMVVLERVREDIYEHKKLNVHLFNCLKRGLYKPAGFFKGLFGFHGNAHVLLLTLGFRVFVPLGSIW